VLDRARERVDGDGGASRADSWVEDRRRPKEEVDTPRMEVMSRVIGDRGCWYYTGFDRGYTFGLDSREGLAFNTSADRGQTFAFTHYSLFLSTSAP
jgi:hypothetical protein